MPDIAKHSQSETQSSLDRVGMSDVQIPLKLIINGEKLSLAAKADLYVNLEKADAKGIHMSRLFLKAQEKFEKNNFSLNLLKELLQEFITSHKDLSSEAFIRVKFDLITLRRALLSDYAGWRSYPVEIEAKKTATETTFSLNFEVLYSSTCPCSAALSRQLVQDHFKASFKDEKINTADVATWLGETSNMVATPHSQRSVLSTKIRVDGKQGEVSFIKYIDALEKALATPVQTAVKREDEQEFARLNAANLMFCEDAARKVKACLNSFAEVSDFWLKVEHLESLHPHNAVSIATKGIAGGFRAE